MKLEGGERLVLKSLADLQGLSTGYVDDARLAVATKMLVEDVRDWLETLEGKGFVVVNLRTHDGLASIIIPCWNQLESFRFCLPALVRHPMASASSRRVSRDPPVPLRITCLALATHSRLG